MNKSHTKIRMLCESAILIALGTVLSMIKIIDIPWGGGITLFAMLPVILIAYRWGTKWGLFSAFIFSIIQLIIGLATNSFGMPNMISLVFMLIFDYILAYTALGLGGVFRNKFKTATSSLVLGTILAVFSRYLMHMISGAIFYGSYAEWFFTDSEFPRGIGMNLYNLFSSSTFGLAVSYSVVYNGILMICELVITLVAAIIISKIPYISKKQTSL